MTHKLYELREMYENVLNLDQDADTMAALVAIEDDFISKFESMAKMVKCLEGDSDVIKAEEARLQAKRKALENKVESIKNYMFEQLEMIDSKKVKTALFTVAIQKNAPSVAVVDESIIPKDYIIIEEKLDKKGILQALKDGLEVPGAELKQSESLRIR